MHKLEKKREYNFIDTLIGKEEGHGRKVTDLKLDDYERMQNIKDVIINRKVGDKVGTDKVPRDMKRIEKEKKHLMRTYKMLIKNTIRYSIECGGRISDSKDKKCKERLWSSGFNWNNFGTITNTRKMLRTLRVLNIPILK